MLSTHGFTLKLLGFQVALTFIALGLRLFFIDKSFTNEFSLNEASLLWTSYCFFGLCSFALFLTSPIVRNVPTVQKIMTYLREGPVGDWIRSTSMTSLLLVSLMAGVSEEILFRSFLQNWIGPLWSSLIFALAHALTFTYFLLALLVSGFLAFIYESSGHLVLPVLIGHFLYDFIVFLRLKRAWTTNCEP